MAVREVHRGRIRVRGRRRRHLRPQRPPLLTRNSEPLARAVADAASGTGGAQGCAGGRQAPLHVGVALPELAPSGRDGRSGRSRLPPGAQKNAREATGNSYRWRRQAGIVVGMHTNRDVNCAFCAIAAGEVAAGIVREWPDASLSSPAC